MSERPHNKVNAGDTNVVSTARLCLTITHLGGLSEMGH